MRRRGDAAAAYSEQAGDADDAAIGSFLLSLEIENGERGKTRQPRRALFFGLRNVKAVKTVMQRGDIVHKGKGVRVTRQCECAKNSGGANAETYNLRARAQMSKSVRRNAQICSSERARQCKCKRASSKQTNCAKS
jgi:hypothetical protein